MIQGLRDVAVLPDPVGGVDSERVLPNGLRVGRMRIPLGVIAIIYESRPNVTIDAAALCVKAGNAVILRGGSEAFRTNRELGEELRGAVRISFANYWSLFGSGVFNLTNREEDPTLESDGFDPIRTRLGVAYQDDCLELGVTWRRDYITSGDAERGDTFQFYFSLRNLGFR